MKCKALLKYIELGVDGNAGFALLGEDSQSGEIEYIEIALPPEINKDPDRYENSEWCRVAEIAAFAAYWALKARLPEHEFLYYFGPSHPNYAARRKLMKTTAE